MKNAIIIDVRTVEEFEIEHAHGSINIPYVEVPERLAEIKLLSKPIIICCETGNESKQVAAYLNYNGIECTNGGCWYELENTKKEEMRTLDENFWNERYENNETGWDLGAPSPPISAYIDTLENKELKILIPGCGNAHEAEYLLERGFANVTLVDISKEAVMRQQQRFQGKAIQIIHADFFAHNGQYDLMLEQTFFCAINPSLRENYVKHTAEILKPNGKLVGLLFNCEFGKEGPPFGGEKSEYERLFSPYFNIQQMEPAANSVKPRLGNELFIELTKK